MNENVVQVPLQNHNVTFSEATYEDCIRPEGLALDLRYILSPNFDVPTLHIPDDVASPTPSDFLCNNLTGIRKVWTMDGNGSLAMLIDAVLTEVLNSDANEKLEGFCEVNNDWQGQGVSYTGNVDYMLGSSPDRTVEHLDSLWMVKQDKKVWPDVDIPQVICEAGCLLKRRLDAGEDTPVFAVLTNGSTFRFVCIDVDGAVYASKTIALQLGHDGTYKTSSTLSEILRWFSWFMNVVKSICPAASSERLTQDQINESLSQLRTCFGPK